MNVKNLLIALGSSIIISACSTVDPIEIKTVEQPKIYLNLSDPSVVELRDYKWVIITPENAEEVFKILEKMNIDPVLFGLTDNNYQYASENEKLKGNFMIELKSIIDAYREYYEPENVDVPE